MGGLAANARCGCPVHGALGYHRHVTGHNRGDAELGGYRLGDAHRPPGAGIEREDRALLLPRRGHVRYLHFCRLASRVLHQDPGLETSPLVRAGRALRQVPGCTGAGDFLRVDVKPGRCVPVVGPGYYCPSITVSRDRRLPPGPVPGADLHPAVHPFSHAARVDLLHVHVRLEHRFRSLDPRKDSAAGAVGNTNGGCLLALRCTHRDSGRGPYRFPVRVQSLRVDIEPGRLLVSIVPPRDYRALRSIGHDARLPLVPFTGGNGHAVAGPLDDTPARAYLLSVYAPTGPTAVIVPGDDRASGAVGGYPRVSLVVGLKANVLSRWCPLFDTILVKPLRQYIDVRPGTFVLPDEYGAAGAV